MRTGRHVVVFVRAPQLGRVKRRLAADIGDLAAWRFYREATHGLLHRLGRDRRWRVWLWVTPDRFARPGAFWPNKFSRRAQGGGDLGIRMARAFRGLPPGPAVIVGSDIPELASRHVSAAFAALGANDFVFGPAEDGGFWLVGASRRRPLAALFADVRWSSASALADTRATIDSRRRVALLAPLADIDSAADFHRWRSRRAKS